MSAAIVVVILLCFSVCVIVGLVTVLRDLINHPLEPLPHCFVSDQSLLSEQGADK